MYYTLWYFVLYAGILENTMVIVLNAVVFCTYTCILYTFAYKTLHIMLG